MYDYILIGGGPIAYITALYLILNVTSNFVIIDPHPEKEWPCTTCTWTDDLKGTWFDKTGITYAKYTWPNIKIKVDDATDVTIKSEYMMYDNDNIKSFIKEKISDKIINGYATFIDSDNHIVRYISGSISDGIVDKQEKHILGRKIIDITGHYTFLKQYPIQPNRAWQTFYGQILEGSHGYDLNTACLFDWSFDPKDGYMPSFAYILPLSENEIFIEETILVDTSNCYEGIITQRINQRKEKMGFDGFKVKWSERVSFPMGGSKRSADGIYAFGAANRDVHPSTGFMISYVINRIPEYINRIESDDNLDTLDDLLKYSIYLIGAQILMNLKTIDMYRTFFSTFFKIPTNSWFIFMTRRGTILDLVISMLYFFFYAPLRLKFSILTNIIRNIGLMFA